MERRKAEDVIFSKKLSSDVEQSDGQPVPSANDATSKNLIPSPLSASSSNITAANNHEEPHLLLHPTASLPLLNTVDMFSVSLVVPLLFQYYKNSGVDDASTRELLSSIFSSSQIVGGLALGALTDAGILSRRTVLFISFAGSAVAYFLIVAGGLPALIISRVLVGLVKQTQTVSTTLVTKYSRKEHRAKYIGRLNASSTFAWIAGPSVGALLYKNVDHRAPALLACFLFLFNILLAFILLPHRERATSVHEHHNDTINNNLSSPTKGHPTKKASFLQNLKSCFQSKALGSTISSVLIFTWVTKATSYSTMASYYEEMYGMEPHHRGYLSSYQSVLQFLVQSFLVGPLLRWMGGERRATVFSAALLSLATLLEMQRSLYLFLIVLCPAISLSLALIGLALRSLVTHIAPKDSLGSVLAVLDVLQNATSVTVPIYRTFLFSMLTRGGRDNQDAVMKGDPEPTTWVFSSALHWSVGTVAIAFFLLSNSDDDSSEMIGTSSSRTKHKDNKEV